MILLFPYMRAASASTPPPAGTRLLCPGLEDASTCNSAWRPPNLPFAPAEARLLVRELRAYANDLAGRNRTAADALDEHKPGAKDMDGLARSDAEALICLGLHAAPGPQDNPEQTMLKRAQKILLLARDLEDQCLEARALAQAFCTGQAALPKLVGAEPNVPDAFNEPDDFAEFAPFTPDLPGDPGLPVLNAWERVLDAVCAFTPAETVFLVGHPAIVEVLLARGVRFTKKGAADGQYAEAPLWQALGRANPEDPPTAGRHSPPVRFLAAITHDALT